MPDDHTQSQQIFFERALREARRYGEDPWVFLRELVQNSRDAGAEKISFSTVRTESTESLVCLDDGSGMDTQDFEHYLLRLYASSKEAEAQAVGFFGVGFWSTLLFQPTQIRVISRKQGKSQGLVVDVVTHSVRSFDGHLDHDGTEIQLVRERAQQSDEAFDAEVRDRLIYYVGHVRGKQARQRLRLMFNGEALERKFETPPIMGTWVKQGSTDGVIGFAPNPSVRIYRGGILVRDIASIGELLPNRESSFDSDWGFYPYIRLNIEGLQVLMDRQSVFEDPELHQAVSLCEETLLRLHEDLVSRLFPLPLRQRLQNYLQRHWLKLVGLFAVVVLSVLATTVVQFQNQQSQPRFSEPSATSRTGQPLPRDIQSIPATGANQRSVSNIALVDEAFQNWQGSGIDNPATSPQYQWFFSYSSNEPMLFTLRILDTYDAKLGFLPSDHQRLGGYPRVVSSASAPLRVRVGVRGRRSFALPLPPGYALLADRVWDSRGNVIGVQMNQFGQPTVFVSSSQVIEFETVPTELPPPPQAQVRVPLPPEMQAFLETLGPLATDEQIERTKNFVQTHYSYSDDPELSRRLREGRGDWLMRSWNLAAGDCDVLNGVFVVMLRNLGIHARLEAGLVGNRGTAFRDMHAWAAIYHNQAWRYSDLSNGVQVDVLSDRPGNAPTTQISAAQLNLNQQEQPLPPLPSDFQFGGQQGGATTSERILSPWLLLWFLLVPSVWIVWRLRRKVPLLQEGAYLRELFQHHFHFGASGDPLKLRQRQIFPNLKGALLSIRDLEEAASARGIFLASPGNRIGQKLLPDALILRGDASVLHALREFLPPLTPLDTVDHFLNEHVDLPPLLEHLQRILQEHDPGLRIHLQPESNGITEITLPLKSEFTGLGERHLIIGAEHQLLSIYPLDSQLNQQDMFFVLRQLLRHTTFYAQDADAILGSYADRVFAVEASA